MNKLISRRHLLASGASGIAALAATSASAFAMCELDHKAMGYKLGAQWVDPALDDAGRQLVASAKCPGCNAHIEPSGLSFGEHMRG